MKFLKFLFGVEQNKETKAIGTRSKAVINTPHLESSFETKFSMVKKHILSGKTISSWEAITLYRCTRLSSYIHRLRKRGYNIVSIPMSKIGYGKTVNYVVYKLIK